MNLERRTFNLDSVGIKKRSDEKSGKELSVIRGHAAVFDKLSEPLGGFREVIAKGAFDNVLNDDVRALFNHDPNHILGRTTSGTLRLSVDDVGLGFEIDIPDTTLGRDLAVSMERGDITQSSFAFRIEDEIWEENEEGRIVRTITKVKALLDVSPVTYPAYQDTDVSARGFEKWKEEKAKAEKTVNTEQMETYKRQLQLVKVKGAGYLQSDDC